MRQRLQARSYLRLLGQEPLRELDALAEVTDLTPRLLDLSEQVFPQHLKLFPDACICAPTDPLCQSADHRIQEYETADECDGGEEGHALGGHQRVPGGARSIIATRPMRSSGFTARPPDCVQPIEIGRAHV